MRLEVADVFKFLNPFSKCIANNFSNRTDMELANFLILENIQKKIKKFYKEHKRMELTVRLRRFINELE